MKRILIIAGSPRRNGNSDLLAQQFARGAKENGNQVEMVYLRDLVIDYCQGCLFCLKKGECYQQDDVNFLLPKMMDADVICFASPVYYYSVSGQMKTFIDRMNPLYERMKNKDFYYMVTASEEDHKQLDRAFDVFEGFADCFEGIHRCGRIYGGGASDKGDIKQLEAFNEAYEMGKAIK